MIAGTDISDVESCDEEGAPRAIWLINIMREDKKKSRVADNKSK